MPGLYPSLLWPPRVAFLLDTIGVHTCPHMWCPRLQVVLSRGPGTAALLREQLLSPTHWFALWRLNCALVAWHARVAGARARPQYALEDKVRTKGRGVP